MATPAITYAAKSTEDRHGSIPTQLADCRAMAEREGWAVEGTYSDEGSSAFSGNRGPGLAAARERAAALAAGPAGEAVLVVQHSDRLARGAGDKPGAPQHLAEIMFESARVNVRLRSVQDDSSLTNPLLTFVMGERNVEDSRRKSASVRDGLARRAERGERLGAVPYGYRPNMAPDPEAATAVRSIFESYLAGRSTRAIGIALNASGIKPSRAAAWSSSSVAKVLRGPAVIGLRTAGGEVQGWGHDPIVPLDLWLAVQRRMDRLGAERGNGGGRPPRGGHLLAGMLRCGACGSNMVSRSRPAGQGIDSYVCAGRRDHGAGHCSLDPVPRVAVDEAVLNYFATVGLDLEATQAQLQATADAASADASAALKRADAALLAAKAAVERVDAAMLAGHLAPENYERLRATATADHSTALERTTAAREALPGPVDASVAADLLDALRRAVAAGEGDLTAPRAALGELFELFEVDRLAEGWDAADVAPVDASGWAITPVPRVEALLAGLIDENGEPVLRRVGITGHEALVIRTTG